MSRSNNVNLYDFLKDEVTLLNCLCDKLEPYRDLNINLQMMFLLSKILNNKLESLKDDNYNQIYKESIKTNISLLKVYLLNVRKNLEESNDLTNEVKELMTHLDKKLNPDAPELQAAGNGNNITSNTNRPFLNDGTRIGIMVICLGFATVLGLSFAINYMDHIKKHLANTIDKLPKYGYFTSKVLSERINNNILTK